VDQLEQMLRDTLTDSRLDMMVRPTAVELVHEGVRRRRRNRRVASAAAVAAVGMASAATIITTTLAPTTAVVTAPTTPSPKPIVKPPAPETKTTNVPWQNIDYHYQSPPAFPGAVADPSVPWCTAAQLSMTAEFQGATGNSVGAAQLTNTSAQPCALQGEPGVRILDAAGTQLVSHAPETFYVYPWVRLRPGATARSFINWSQEFCHEPAPASMAIALPHDGGVMSTAMTFPPRCNSQSDPTTTGTLNADGFLLDNSPDAWTPEAGLQAQMTSAPTAVIAGGTATYHVQLASDGDTNISLSPCLPFRERLINQVTGATIEEDHVLNCAAAPTSLDNGQVLDFELKLAVPPGAVSGNYSLVWQSVLTNVNAVAADVVRIDGSPPPCADGQLSASAAPSTGSLMNQFGQVVIFTNTSGTACSLRGYAGLQLVDAAGRPMTAPTRRGGGYVFSDPDWTTVVLAATGGRASFTFGGEMVDRAGALCPDAAGIRVIPPGDREQLSVTIAVPACPAGLDVAKVVAGAGGSHF